MPKKQRNPHDQTPFPDPLHATVARLETLLEQLEGEKREQGERAVQYQTLYSMLRSMCDNMPDLIWAKDLNKNYLYANKAICEKLLSAETLDEPVGRNDLFFAERQRAMHPDQADWHTFGEICQDSDTLIMESRQAGRFEEYGNVRGEMLFLDVYKAPFFNADGELIGTVGCGRDVTREKRAEEAHRETVQALHVLADHYQSIINASLDGFVLLDANKTIIDTNEAYCAMTGYAREEIIGKAISDFDVRKSDEEIESHFQKVVEQGRDRFETLHCLKDGNLMAVEVNVTYSSITGCQGAFVRNITPRKAIEKALTESQERYRILLYSVTDYIYSVVLEHGVVVSTTHGPGCLAVTGYVQDDFAEDPHLWITMVWSEDRERVGNHAREILSGQDPGALEHRIVHRDGSLRWVRNVPVLWRDADGSVVAYDGLISDITERKTIEEALRQSEEQARRIIDASPEGMVIHNRDQILYANPAAVRLSKLPSGQSLHGRALSEFVHPDDRGLMAERMQMLQKGGTDLPLAQYRLLMFDGSIIDVEVTSTPVEYDGVPAILSMTRDVSARMNAERALRDSERQLRSMMENLPDVIVRFDRNLWIVYMSSAVERYGDKSADYYVGKSYLALPVGEERRNALRNALNEVMQEGKVVEMEYSDAASGNRVISVNLRLVPERDDRGEVRTVLCIARDITEHRRIEQDYRALFNSMVEGFALHELLCGADGAPYDYRYLAVNPAFEVMTGLESSHLIGRTVREIFADIDSFWIEKYGKVVQTGEPVHFEHFSRELDRWFEITAYRPAPQQFACIVIDTTERRRAQEALSNSQRILTDIINFLPDATFAIDLQGRVIFWNRVAEEFTGVVAADMIGKGNYEYSVPFYGERRPILIDLVLHPSEDVERHYQHISRNGETLIGEGYTRSVKRGEAYMLGIAAPLYDSSGNLTGAIESVTDITDRRKLEEQLRQSQKMEAIGILAGGVAHDFNNIVQAILGNAYLLKRRSQDNPEEQIFLEEIIGLSNRAADLTKGLLAFSRKQFISPQSIDLNVIVRGASNILARLIGEDIVLQTAFSAQPLMVHVDPGQIHQVLLNLATNARDAMPNGGRLAIATDLEVRPGTVQGGAESRFAVVTVQDSGSGIADQDLAHIFEPFYTTKDVGKGTGLGLAVVYGIVKQHQGEVEVDSVVGKGTSFRILLPLSEQRAETQPAVTSGPVAGGSETILLIEDDAGVRRSTRRLLESSGYQVIEACDGAEGLAQFNKHRDTIGLVLVDVIMPGLNGKEVYEQLAQIDPGVRAIFVSGYPEDVLSRKKLDSTGYITKPIMPEDLLAKIRAVMDA